MLAMETFNLPNCSIFDAISYNSSEESVNGSFRNVDIFLAAGFSNITGITMIFFFNAILYNNYVISSLKIKLYDLFTEKNISRIIVLSILVLIMPLVTVVLILALIYKFLCSVAIRNKDKNFVAFLDSFDVFWCLGNDTSKNIINVIGVIEAKSSEALVECMRTKLKSVFTVGCGENIFYRRIEDFGFYYWRRCSEGSVDIEQYVKTVELPKKCKEAKMTDLEKFMTSIEHQSLPHENEGLFQILVINDRIGNYSSIRGNYGVIFRIHHSVGDGVALMEFLCKTLADEKDCCPINVFTSQEAINIRNNSPKAILGMIKKLSNIPLCFVDGIIRKPDENSLHGKKLSGRKFFKWLDLDENLLEMVKDIKNNVEGYRFSDVLMMALSGGLRKYFLERTQKFPDDMAVVLPIRFPQKVKKGNPKFGNDFSVTILDLPLKYHQICEIKKRCDCVRESADPLTNYYFLKIVNSVLPKQILQPLMNSSQASMVFSNLPGPECLSICGGNILKSLVFFVPHKGNTGLCVTALCYGGVLRFGAMADAALVPNGDRLACILDGMAEEIRRLHKIHVHN